jgi:site-specific recombinase XerC
MKGHIRERSPGHWAIILDVRDATTGKRRRRWHSFHGTKRQAQIECARLISEVKGGTYVEPSKMTLAQFLERWLDNVKPRISPRTHERYTEIVRKNIIPALGAIHLIKLRPAQIAGAYSDALASGRRNGRGGLAPTSVIYMHRIIKQSLGQAVRWELLARNPADAVDPPKAERRTLTTYDMDQTAELLESLRGTRLRLPVLIAVMCGCR